MIKSILPVVLSCAILGLSPVHAQTSGGGSSISSMVVSRSFDFSTERRVQVEIDVLDREGFPAPNKVVEVLEVLDETGLNTRLIERALTDASGYYRADLTIPGHLTTLLVRTGVLGIANQAIVPIADDQLIHSFN